MHATFPIHRITFDLIIVIVFGEDYKFRSSSLCNIIKLSSISLLFGQNVLISAFFSNTLNLCTSLTSDANSHAYKKLQAKL
jgi:hypothetical protein